MKAALAATLVAAAALIAAALLLFVVPVRLTFQVPPDGEATVSCGSALNSTPVSLACPDAQATRQAWGFGVGGVGVLAGVGAGVLFARRASRHPAATA